MSKTATHIFRWLLSQALARKCPDRVPRSGSAGSKVNCFVVYVNHGTDPYLLIREVSGDVVICSEWTGSTFDKPVEVPIASIARSDLAVTHFYGLDEINYSGLASWAWGRILLWPYAKLWFIRVVGSVDQYFFNKRKLVTKQRIDLLKILVTRELEGRAISSPIDLMTELYSLRWVMHPERDPQQRRLRFYLDSLVDTGELKRTSGDYKLTGEALKAIEVYEEQERKHTESVKEQRRMAWLTLAIVLLTAIQAGLVKLPTFLDWSR